MNNKKLGREFQFFICLFDEAKQTYKKLKSNLYNYILNKNNKEMTITFGKVSFDNKYYFFDELFDTFNKCINGNINRYKNNNHVKIYYTDYTPSTIFSKSCTYKYTYINSTEYYYNRYKICNVVYQEFNYKDFKFNRLVIEFKPQKYEECNRLPEYINVLIIGLKIIIRVIENPKNILQIDKFYRDNYFYKKLSLFVPKIICYIPEIILETSDLIESNRILFKYFSSDTLVDYNLSETNFSNISNIPKSFTTQIDNIKLYYNHTKKEQLELIKKNSIDSSVIYYIKCIIQFIKNLNIFKHSIQQLSSVNIIKWNINPFELNKDELDNLLIYIYTQEIGNMYITNHNYEFDFLECINNHFLKQLISFDRINYNMNPKLYNFKKIYNDEILKKFIHFYKLLYISLRIKTNRYTLKYIFSYCHSKNINNYILHYTL